jgi:hypothetical protein
MREMLERIEGDGASFEEELSFAYSIIVQLQEDKAWLRGVEDELRAASSKLEALRSSNKKDKHLLRRVVSNVIVGLTTVASLSGYNLQDLTGHNESLSALVVLVDVDEPPALGLPPQTVQVQGAAALVFAGAAAATVSVTSQPIQPGGTEDVNGIKVVNMTHGELMVEVSTGQTDGGRWFDPGERELFSILDREDELVTIENAREDDSPRCVLVKVDGIANLVRYGGDPPHV